MTRLYAYCLCDGVEAGRLDLGGEAGVGGCAARVLTVGGFAAVVGDFAGERVGVGREELMAHNRVNGLVLALTTPLPFRFGTLVTAGRLGEYVRRNEAALRAGLGRVEGCVEMGVKIIRRPAGAGACEESGGPDEALPSGKGGVPIALTAGGEPSVERGEEGAAPAGLSAPRAGRGTAYLAARRRAIMGDERLRAGAEEIAAGLAKFLSGVVRESSERLSPAEALAVRAAHLVERGRVAEYQSRLREFGAARPGLRLLASGPWPPYSFAA